jgi:membrane protease YdiL (CAAX protease family)
MLSAQSWRPEPVLRMIMWLFVCLSVGSLAIYGLHPTSDAPLPPELRFPAFVIGTLSFNGSALVLVGMLVREHATTWREAFGLGIEPRQALRTALAGSAVILPAMFLLVEACARLMQLLEREPVPQGIINTIQKANSPSEIVAYGVAAVLLAPVVEELLFRGILYPTIKAAGFPRWAWGGTSVLFAAMHVNLMTFLPLLLLSLILTWLYERTRNLLAPITAHVVFNAVNFYLLLATSSPDL